MGSGQINFGANYKVLRSQPAEKGAVRLLERVEKEELLMEIIPNTYPEFTGDAEERDFQSYCRFLQDVNGRRIIKLLEECDAEECTEL